MVASLADDTSDVSITAGMRREILMLNE